MLSMEKPQKINPLNEEVAKMENCKNGKLQRWKTAKMESCKDGKNAKMQKNIPIVLGKCG